jgi:VWFA-related protein
MAKTLRTLVVAASLLAIAGIRGDAQAPQPAQPPAQQPQQPPPADPQQPPTFRTGINFVRVDVILTDKNGNPLGDLQQADFDVTEDGKPQKIESFKLIKLDGGASEAVKEPPRAIRTDSDEESEAARDDVRLFAIFLDDYHVRRGSSLSARNQLAKFVETQLGPSDMVGVMYPLESTASVRMTRDHSAVVRGLQQFLGRKFDYEVKNEYEERYAHYPTEVVERIRTQVSMSAIKALIVHMGSLKEGRKALILVSEGFSYMLPPQMRNSNAQMPGSGNPNAFNPLAGQNDLNESRAAWQSGLDLDTDLREIYDTANRFNVAIYSVDPRGLAGFEFDINENVGITTDAKYLASTMDTLRVLSENTDGRAIVNRNDLASGMAQITRDSSAYYLIGYNSTQAPTDGKFHEIKVRVKRPGVQVRARKGYWAMTASDAARALAPAKEAPPSAVTNALNAVAARSSSAAVVRTWIGTTRAADGRPRMTFVWEPIVHPPGDAARGEAPARVSVMAVGPDGNPYYRGKVDGVPASGVNTGRGGQVSFEVNPGKVQIRLSVEGAGSQVLDTEMREIAVPDLTSPQAHLGTPAFFRARTLREFQLLKTDGAATPTAAREFSRTDRVLVRVAAYGPGTVAPTVAVHLLNRAGQAMSEVPVSPAPSEGEQQLEIPLSGLAPGEYILQIKASADGGEVQDHVGFRVTG